MGTPHKPVGTRKAQAFTIRTSGSRQPINIYGKPALYAQASLMLMFARSLSRSRFRGANEQIKCHVPKNTLQMYNVFGKTQRKRRKKEKE